MGTPYSKPQQPPISNLQSSISNLQSPISNLQTLKYRSPILALNHRSLLSKKLLRGTIMVLCVKNGVQAVEVVRDASVLSWSACSFSVTYGGALCDISLNEGEEKTFSFVNASVFKEGENHKRLTFHVQLANLLHLAPCIQLGKVQFRSEVSGMADYTSQIELEAFLAVALMNDPFTGSDDYQRFPLSLNYIESIIQLGENNLGTNFSFGNNSQFTMTVRVVKNTADRFSGNFSIRICEEVEDSTVNPIPAFSTNKAYIKSVSVGVLLFCLVFGRGVFQVEEEIAEYK